MKMCVWVVKYNNTTTHLDEFVLCAKRGQKQLVATKYGCPPKAVHILHTDQLQAASGGQSNQPAGEAGHHMVCFVAVGGHLYDLDSLSTNPLSVGECGDTEQLQTMALSAAKAYMDRYTHR